MIAIAPYCLACDRVPLRMSRRKLKVAVRAPMRVSFARSLFFVKAMPDYFPIIK